MRLRLSHPAVALVTVVLLAAPRAEAYCRTTTSTVPPDYDPSISGCWNYGLPLYWANACVSYDIQENASRQVPYALAAEDIAIAFSQWTSTTCADGSEGSGRVSIDVRDFGPVACNKVEYNQYGPNQHAIIFRDTGWPYHDSSNTLALTTVTYDKTTGEIYDADMEINTTQPLSTTPTVDPGGFDFLSIVTHETGHFLGMAHSTDTHATMYAHYTPGDEVMRTLTEDDVSGICSIYAPDGLRHVAKAASPSGVLPEEACDPTPRHGFTPECIMSSAPSTSSCAAAPPGRAGDPRSVAGLLAAAALATVRRRRATRGSVRRAG
jgi:hypothetical protein